MNDNSWFCQISNFIAGGFTPSLFHLQLTRMGGDTPIDLVIVIRNKNQTKEFMIFLAVLNSIKNK